MRESFRNSASRKVYFSWLCSHVIDDVSTSGYFNLLNYLFARDFYSKIDYDSNRAEDGLDLRIQFEDEEQLIFDDTFMNKPCSILEMLVGLALRIENHIMWDPEQGDRTHVWFWDMIANLGLDIFDDFWLQTVDDYDACNTQIDIFLERTYNPDGSNGGLFPLLHPSKDQRRVEIWYQMSEYLQERYSIDDMDDDLDVV